MSLFKNKLPYIATSISAVIFGFSFLFSKDALDSLSYFQLLGFRFIIAALFLTLLKVVGIIKVDISRESLKKLVPVALLQPVLYFIFETIGVGYTSASEAGMIISLVTVSIIFFAVILLKERLTKLQWFSIAVSVMGVVFIVFAKLDKEHFIGIAALIAAVIAAGLYNVFSRKVSCSCTPIQTTFVMMWVGAIIFNFIGFSDSIISGKLSNYFVSLSNPSVLIAIGYLSIISSVAAFFLLNYSLSKIEASKSAVFMNLTPVISVIAGVIFGGEDFQKLQYVGAGLILLGIWGTNYRKKAHPKVLAAQFLQKGQVSENE